MSGEPEYMTTAEVAELCRISPDTVRWWRHIGYGPPGFKLGRRVVYARLEVEAWLRTQHDLDRSTWPVED